MFNSVPIDATFQIEPLDVYFSLLLKSMCKRTVSFVSVHDLDFHVNNRSSMIRPISLVYLLFSASRLKGSFLLIVCIRATA